MRCRRRRLTGSSRSMSWTSSTSSSRRSCLRTLASKDITLTGERGEVSRGCGAGRRAARAAASPGPSKTSGCLSSMCTPRLPPGARRLGLAQVEQLLEGEHADAGRRTSHSPGRLRGQRSRARSCTDLGEVEVLHEPAVLLAPSTTMRRRRCANSARSATSVVRARSRSWRQTRTPSRVLTTSGSTESAPLRHASR